MGRKARNRRLWVDYGLTITLAVLIALGIRLFFIEAYRIPSPAMKPALLPGDTIFVSKWDYSLSKLTGRLPTPARGEVIVFSPPTDTRLNFIKRVVALPGETVEVTEGRVRINGAEISDPASECGKEQPAPGLSYDVCRDKPLLEDLSAEKVPPGSVFVIGDLRAQGRNESRKNKSWGIVPVSAIKGRAEWIWLSIQPREINEPRRSFPKLRWQRMFKRIS